MVHPARTTQISALGLAVGNELVTTSGVWIKITSGGVKEERGWGVVIVDLYIQSLVLSALAGVLSA